ncbi:MAG: hypothetical protein WKG01_20560 [Kofleriaceae bacterium]
MAFSWLDRTDRPFAEQSKARGVAVAEEELASRAALLYRLGYSEADATERLVARIAWEFDSTAKHSSLRRPDSLSEQAIGKIVSATYARRPR